MHTLALKDNKRSRVHDPTVEAGSPLLNKEDYDDLLNYLNKKYQVFIGSGAQLPSGKENQEEDQIQLYYVSNNNVNVKVHHADSSFQNPSEQRNGGF
jgi:hypothetical protein